MPKLYLRTFGCQMNEYDSAKIADVLRVAQGAEPTARPEDADLIVFNTCSVREKAQEKVFADLGRVRHLKRTNPGLMIAVGGCVASQEGAAIVERAQLSAGAQIRGVSNTIVLPTALPPESLVKYQRNEARQVHRVWILTPEEAAQPDKR